MSETTVNSEWARPGRDTFLMLLKEWDGGKIMRPNHSAVKCPRLIPTLNFDSLDDAQECLNSVQWRRSTSRMYDGNIKTCRNNWGRKLSECSVLTLSEVPGIVEGCLSHDTVWLCSCLCHHGVWHFVTYVHLPSCQELAETSNECALDLEP